MPRPLLPKHSPALRAGDYAPYLLEWMRPRPSRPLEEVWSEQLPDRALGGTRAGREALWRFLEAVNPPLNSEVPIAAYNFYVVVRMLVQKGLRPVFVDIDRDTLGIDPEDLRRKISLSSSLVVVTHMFGIPADMEATAAVCREAGLPLFEDCAHGVGTLAGDGHVGRFGDGALFSFGPSKSVTGFGGGMLAVAPRLRDRVEDASPPVKERWMARWGVFFRMLVALMSTPALFGWTLYPLTVFGHYLSRGCFTLLSDFLSPSKDKGSYRFDPGAHPPFRDFMPAMLELQLRRLDDDIARRRETIATVKEALAANPAIGLLDEDRHGRANGSYFGLYVPDPEDFAAHMLRCGIEVNPHEFYDCSGLAQFAEFAAECPNAAYATSHLVRLPSYPALRPCDVERIITATNSYFTDARAHVPSAVPAP